MGLIYNDMLVTIGSISKSVTMSGFHVNTSKLVKRAVSNGITNSTITRDLNAYYTKLVNEAVELSAKKLLSSTWKISLI